jgi:hypothetical protein
MPCTPFGEVDAFVSQIAQYLMLQGDARSVAVLVASEAALIRGDSDFGRTSWELRIRLPGPFFVNITDEERSACEIVIEVAANAVKSADYDSVSLVKIVVGVEPKKDWRQDAYAWLRGEGINNQGRVRSDNLPSRQEDGLLFRSKPEIHVYKALKAHGVTFAPLAVFLRGGATYQRIEPDFVVLQEGKMMLLEVDGDTHHMESPAEADRRTRMFEDEGAFIHHVQASECDTPEKATAAVHDLLAAFERRRRSR